MNIQEYLLDCAAEESSEIIKECIKANRFGLNDTHKEGVPPVRERLQQEINQFLGVVSLLVDHHIIDPNWESAEQQQAKREKVQKYMGYSVERGCLKK